MSKKEFEGKMREIAVAWKKSPQDITKAWAYSYYGLLHGDYDAVTTLMWDHIQKNAIGEDKDLAEGLLKEFGTNSALDLLRYFIITKVAFSDDVLRRIIRAKQAAVYLEVYKDKKNKLKELFFKDWKERGDTSSLLDKDTIKLIGDYVTIAPEHMLEASLALKD